MAAKVKPFELLCRRYQQEYGHERLELSGPDGMPLLPPTENMFNVVWNCVRRRRGRNCHRSERFRMSSSAASMMANGGNIESRAMKHRRGNGTANEQKAAGRYRRTSSAVCCVVHLRS
jgi:hypothetical protein